MPASYSFQDINATLTGPSGSINLGYGAKVAEEGITVEMLEDKNTMTIGADGGGMHSRHAGNAGHIIVRILKTSPVNAQLMTAFNEQRTNDSLWGQNTIGISNKQSGDLIGGSQVAFKKQPSISYRKVGEFYEWGFDAVSVDAILGVY